MPLAGSHKFNVDVSRVEWCNKVAVGGVIRDYKGRILIAFERPIGDVPILVTECMLTSAGVGLARSKKIRNIKVKSDAIQVIQPVNKDMYSSRLISILVQEI